MLSEMNSNLYEAYLPSMVWLQNDDANIYRDDSLSSPWPKADPSVAIPGKPFQQLALDDLSIFAESKSQKFRSDEHSSPMERNSSKDIYDELYLPSEKQSHDNRNICTNSVYQPAPGQLDPAQRLPRSETPIYALPACLVAGFQRHRSFQTLPPGSRNPNQRPETLQAPPRPPKVVQKSVAPHSGASNPHVERVNLRPSTLITGKRRRPTQTFDLVQFAQVPSHYDLSKKADNQVLQNHVSPSSYLPTLRPVSPLRYSAIFPAPLDGSGSPNEIKQSSRVGQPPERQTYKVSEIRSRTGGLLGRDVHSKPSQRVNAQHHSAQHLDPEQFTPMRSGHELHAQNNNPGQQAKKSLAPQIPPLRPVSALRFSGIFPAFAERFDTTSHSPQTDFHQTKQVFKAEISRIGIPSSLDGSNDVAPGDLQSLPSQRARVGLTSNTTNPHDALHEPIRRRNGYENGRLQSTLNTLPPLPVLPPMAFPDFSLDM